MGSILSFLVVRLVRLIRKRSLLVFSAPLDVLVDQVKVHVLRWTFDDTLWSWRVVRNRRFGRGLVGRGANTPTVIMIAIAIFADIRSLPFRIFFFGRAWS